MLTLFGLFSAAFVAATLLPAQSELLLAGLLIQGAHAAWLLIAVASLGNVLGSLVNWLLGRLCTRFIGHKYFPFSPEAIARAQARYARYGWWSLFASWVPIIGDPLTFIAGMMREPLWRFLLVVSIAKTGRYLVIAAGLHMAGAS